MSEHVSCNAVGMILRMKYWIECELFEHLQARTSVKKSFVPRLCLLTRRIDGVDLNESTLINFVFVIYCNMGAGM